jgi:hypothetical protein
LNLEATRSPETTVSNTFTWHHIPEDGILHSHRRENLKFYLLVYNAMQFIDSTLAWYLLHAGFLLGSF